MLLSGHYNQLAMNAQFALATNQVASSLQAPRMLMILVSQLVLLLTLKLPEMTVCVRVFVHIAPQSVVCTSEALSGLPLELPSPGTMLSRAKCFVPYKCGFEVSSISERAQQKWVSPAVPSAVCREGGEIKRQLEKSVLLKQAPCCWAQY